MENIMKFETFQAKFPKKNGWKFQGGNFDVEIFGFSAGKHLKNTLFPHQISTLENSTWK